MYILENLVYSKLENEYDRFYAEFCENVPEHIKKYFHKNWHIIKKEWVTYFMSYMNFNTFKNNRLESTNVKFKAVIPLRSTFCSFIQFLCFFYGKILKQMLE